MDSSDSTLNLIQDLKNELSNQLVLRIMTFLNKLRTTFHSLPRGKRIERSLHIVGILNNIYTSDGHELDLGFAVQELQRICDGYTEPVQKCILLESFMQKTHQVEWKQFIVWYEQRETSNSDIGAPTYEDTLLSVDRHNEILKDSLHNLIEMCDTYCSELSEYARLMKLLELVNRARKNISKLNNIRNLQQILDNCRARFQLNASWVHAVEYLILSFFDMIGYSHSVQRYTSFLRRRGESLFQDYYRYAINPFDQSVSQ